jgi:hypothetical protein
MEMGDESLAEDEEAGADGEEAEAKFWLAMRRAAGDDCDAVWAVDFIGDLVFLMGEAGLDENEEKKYD